MEDAVAFGPAAEDTLVYAIIVSNAAVALGARFAKNELLVTVPEGIAREWALGESVGLESTQSVGDRGTLAILVEKDFACLTPRAGDNDADAYPNPAR